jgi:ABC-type sugar transport system ATPase subunit
MTMATRVAVMSMGRLQQVGTPQEVYDRPVNTFVAQFIGTPPMNCVPGTVASSNTVTVGEQTLPVPPGLSSQLEAGRPVIVGVRPEHFEVAADGPVQAQVRAVEWLGHECLISAALGDHPVIVRQAGMAANEAGSSISVSIAAEHVTLFDADTTERIT